VFLNVILWGYFITHLLIWCFTGVCVLWSIVRCSLKACTTLICLINFINIHYKYFEVRAVELPLLEEGWTLKFWCSSFELCYCWQVYVLGIPWSLVSEKIWTCHIHHSTLNFSQLAFCCINRVRICVI